MGCRGTSGLTMGCTTGCRGISAWHLEHLLPSFLTGLGVSRIVSLIYSHSFLWSKMCTFYNLLNYVIPGMLTGDATITEGRGLGQRWVHLEASWHWLCWTWGKLLAASHKSYPCSSPLPKPCHTNPIHIQINLGKSVMYLMLHRLVCNIVFTL